MDEILTVTINGIDYYQDEIPLILDDNSYTSFVQCGVTSASKEDLRFFCTDEADDSNMSLVKDENIIDKLYNIFIEKHPKPLVAPIILDESNVSEDNPSQNEISIVDQAEDNNFKEAALKEEEINNSDDILVLEDNLDIANDEGISTIYNDKSTNDSIEIEDEEDPPVILPPENNQKSENEDYGYDKIIDPEMELPTDTMSSQENYENANEESQNNTFDSAEDKEDHSEIAEDAIVIENDKENEIDDEESPIETEGYMPPCLNSLDDNSEDSDNEDIVESEVVAAISAKNKKKKRERPTKPPKAKREFKKIYKPERQNKKIKSKTSKKMVFVSLIIAAILIGLMILGNVIWSLTVPDVADNVPVETTITDAEITTTPATEITDPSISEAPELTTYPGNDIKGSFAVLKRILDSKVVVRFEKETLDTIMYIDEYTDLNSLNLSVGSDIYVQYHNVDGSAFLLNMGLTNEGTFLSYDNGSVTLLVGNQTTTLPCIDAVADQLSQINHGEKIRFSEANGEIKNISPMGNLVPSEPDFIIQEQDVSKISGTSNLDSLSAGDRQIIYAQDRSADDNAYFKSDFTNNSVKFYNSYTDPIWIRFAWQSNNPAITSPSVEDVALSFISPSGQRISSSNIADYGRMWIDGQIINIAFSSPEVGEWTLVVNKDNGFLLGESHFHLMKLTGYISLDKFDVNASNGKVEFAWNVGGVKDDALEIEISLLSNRYSTVIYSASSKTDDVHLIDHISIDTNNLPAGTYSVCVTIKDIDLLNGSDLTKEEQEEKGIEEYQVVVTAETISQVINAGTLVI